MLAPPDWDSSNLTIVSVLFERFHSPPRMKASYLQSCLRKPSLQSSTLSKLLKKMVAHLRDWHLRLPEVLWAYRTTYRTPGHALFTSVRSGSGPPTFSGNSLVKDGPPIGLRDEENTPKAGRARRVGWNETRSPAKWLHVWSKTVLNGESTEKCSTLSIAKGFVVYTDHQALRFNQSQEKLNAKDSK